MSRNWNVYSLGSCPNLNARANVLWVIGVDIKAISVVIESEISGIKNAITASNVSENGGASVVKKISNFQVQSVI